MKEGFYSVELNKTVWEVPKRYSSLTPVGSGAYGQVCSALDSETGTKVAIKKLARPFQSAIHAKRTYRELRMLKHMRHENIIGLLDVFMPSESLEEFEDLYLVTHLMGADLNNIIKTQRLSDDHVQFLVYQVLRGLKYIHSAGIIHRDLKPSNIAVNEDCELKILDFGLARQAEQEMTGYVATRWYRAPEIMLNWMHYNQTVDVCCTLDIHQLNLIMNLLGTPSEDFMEKISSDSHNRWIASFFCFPYLVMMNGTDIDQLLRIMALVGTPNKELLRKLGSDEARNYIKSLPAMKKKDFKQVFKGANPQAINLLELMLELDAEKRITAEQALAHPYLSQYADPSDEPTSEPYDQSYEDMDLPVQQWKDYVYQEVLSFVPPPLNSEDM
ncbi:unnamed protein product [Darwinula stevensoni]|uniref:mitogen-activated protein kinase n=1 Tax=Darwinula stevensoni TaxID=69355 RepID=A0A7R8X0J3_9CRUS|nr:unnamed protein product [Darwinula stevensoni]CAG0881741.1 unnamed protein product [Darwinula stevensoni]